MECASPDSSFSWSDYSITEDEAYVYCRVGTSKKGDTQETLWKTDSPKPTFEDWVKSNRDSGFAEKMLENEHVYSDLEEDPRGFDFEGEKVEMDESQSELKDHTYYNFLPLKREGQEEHDYTYPAFNEEKPPDAIMNRKITARKMRSKFRRNESQLSTISAKTVINAARPYRGIAREPSISPLYKDQLTRRKACCVECRDEELKKRGTCTKTNATYENLHCTKECDTIELYGRLILTALVELRASPGGMERTTALQRKIEKILRLHTGIDLATAHGDFETAIKQFETLVVRRLRAIHDISPSCYQKIADKLCYTQSAARRQKTFVVRLASIRKGVLKILGI